MNRGCFGYLFTFFDIYFQSSALIGYPILPPGLIMVWTIDPLFGIMAAFYDLFGNWTRTRKQHMAAEVLIEGLAREESEAIRHLAERTAPFIASISKQFRLSAEEAQELQCDCILIFIQKIRNGAYSIRESDPISYAASIIRNLARNYRRRSDKHYHEPLDQATEVADLDPGYGRKEEVERLETLLDRIDAECRNLIRLKHLEGWRDQEILEKRMTRYQSIPALKNRRSQCMKALAALAQKEFRTLSE